MSPAAWDRSHDRSRTQRHDFVKGIESILLKQRPIIPDAEMPHAQLAGEQQRPDQLAAFAVARGQSNALGSIRGTAVDPTGRIIPDVQITIIDLNRATLTTRDGWFVFDSIPSGAHQVRARRAGSRSSLLPPGTGRAETSAR